MNIEEVTLGVGEQRFPGRLNVPEELPDSGVLVVPGAGHGPFGDVFDRFAEAAADAGHYVARFETWQSTDELSAKTEADVHAEIDAGVEFLRDRGCERVAIVGKSVGARLVLTRGADAVDRIVLWAPAILYGNHDDKPSITASELGKVDVPVRILQGNEDDVVPVANAANLVTHLQAGELVEIVGEDHSFRECPERVVERTLSFLAN